MNAAIHPSPLDRELQLLGLTLDRAQRLADETRETIVDQIQRVLDRTYADRLLLYYIGRQDMEPESLKAFGTTAIELNYQLTDLGKRLSEALKETQRLVEEEWRRENARSLVERARAEGRIP